MPNESDPPEQWRVYEGDATPDPEPSAGAVPSTGPSADQPPIVPYGAPAQVPYGGWGASTPVVTRSTSRGPMLAIAIVVIGLLGAAVAGAVAIFAAIGNGGIGGLGGVDPKDPKDFARMVDELQDKTGSTEVFEVGLYDGYAIVYVPVDKTSDHTIEYRWDGGGFSEFTKSTDSNARFDLRDIDPDVIKGMCGPVLELADGATSDDCYVFISAPLQKGGAWFTAGASDQYTDYYSVSYDKDGKEVSRTCGTEPSCPSH